MTRVTVAVGSGLVMVMASSADTAAKPGSPSAVIVVLSINQPSGTLMGIKGIDFTGATLPLPWAARVRVSGARMLRWK